MDRPLPFLNISVLSKCEYQKSTFRLYWEQGTKLYAVNCASCHGINADGQSFVADKFSEVYNRPPSLRDSVLVKLGTDGTVFSILTNGVVVMPSFKELLTERERWILVHYLKSIAN